MSVSEIVIFTGIATGVTMVVVTPWDELFLMIWGATADSINTGGSYLRDKLEQTGPVGYGFSKFLGFVPGFALLRLAVSPEARESLRKCDVHKVDSFFGFVNRVGCGAKGFFWGD